MGEQGGGGRAEVWLGGVEAGEAKKPRRNERDMAASVIVANTQ